MKFAKSALFASALTITASAAPAAEIQIAAQNPVIELTVSEVVQSAPDTAQVGAGVQIRAMTASEAMRQNALAMERVIARLRQLGIAREDIQTSNFSLNAQYQYTRNDGTPPTFLGYDAGNQVTVTLRKLDKVGETLDALVATGANNIFGPNFSLEKDHTVKETARKAAFARAGAQALDYARMAGYQGVRLLEISESFGGGGSMQASGGAIIVTAVSADAKTPIEPGRVGTGVTVTVKYEMTK